jgi:serine/threonine protein kinase
LTLRDDGSPYIKILDFGIASFRAIEEDNKGEIIGTLFYMSPEQLEGDNHFSGASDIYALGLIAYELIVGRVYGMEELEDAPLIQIFRARLFSPQEAPTTRALRQGVPLPPGFDAWFATATAREPTHRFPRAIEATDALARVFGLEPPSASLSAPSGTPKEQAEAPVPLVFISSASADEAWRARLSTHLGVLKQEDLIEIWHHGCVGAGAELRLEIIGAIERADVAVLLVTADYLQDEFIWEVEIPRILKRQAKGALRVIPVLTRPCDWRGARWLKDVAVYPRHGRPISLGSQQEAERDIAELVAEIRQIVERTVDEEPAHHPSARHSPQYPDEATRALSLQSRTPARARQS